MPNGTPRHGSAQRTLPAKRDVRAHDALPVQPKMESVGGPSAKPSKNLERNKRRMAEYIKKKAMLKWHKIVKALTMMAAHCKGWAIKTEFLKQGLEVRSRALGFLERVVRRERAHSTLRLTHTDPILADGADFLTEYLSTLVLDDVAADIEIVPPSLPLSPSAAAFKPVASVTRKASSDISLPTPAGVQPSISARDSRRPPPKGSPAGSKDKVGKSKRRSK